MLKTFDIVYVMTNGNFNTNVIAVDFFNQLFTNRNAGYAAAIVVILLVIMIGPGVPDPSVPCRGGRPMSGTQAVTPTPVQLPKETPYAGRAKRRGPSEVNRSPIWVRVVLALICLAWIIPTLGLAITSFRSQEDATTSGWWTSSRPRRTSPG